MFIFEKTKQYLREIGGRIIGRKMKNFFKVKKKTLN